MFVTVKPVWSTAMMRNDLLVLTLGRKSLALASASQGGGLDWGAQAASLQLAGNMFA